MSDKPKSRSFLKALGSLPGAFWVINIYQALEISAYWIVIIQLPVYIAQKDVEGGLMWGQETKGWLFFAWALFQRAISTFSGGYADRNGYKKSLAAALALGAAGYAILGAAEVFWIFLGGIIILAAGSGIFKPALHGAVALQLNEKNEPLGWGVYFMILNLAVFFSAFISKWLKEISWEWVFFGSAAISVLNLGLLAFFPKISIEKMPPGPKPGTLKETVSGLFKSEAILFTLLMSGFVILYMQFYETLPNFIFDWIDSSAIVESLNLPDFLTSATPRGEMISYEMLMNLNALVIIISIAAVSWLFSKTARLKAIIAGVALASAGLFLAGFTMAGWLAIVGIAVYTFGEMIVNPKFTEHMASMAPAGRKGMYLGYLNLSFAFGLAGGSLAGGYLYKHLAEKAGLAKKYLTEVLGRAPESVKIENAMKELTAQSGLSEAGATALLWNYYNPWLVWLPFLIIGLISTAGLAIYYRRRKKRNLGRANILHN